MEPAKERDDLRWPGRLHRAAEKGLAELAVALEERGFDTVLSRRKSEHLPQFESPAK
jgi:hypothetical protein